MFIEFNEFKLDVFFLVKFDIYEFKLVYELLFVCVEFKEFRFVVERLFNVDWF